MAGKTISECIACIERDLAAIKAMSGEDDVDESAGMEIAEHDVGRGRKRRPAPFFRKKADKMEESDEDSE